MSTFTARIAFDPIDYQWVEVMAVKTKSVLTLDMSDRTPDEFKGIEKVLWKHITEGGINNESTVALTVEEGKAFKAMCARNKGTAEVEGDRTGNKILDILESKIVGVGADEFEKRLDVLAKLQKAANEQYILISYDIAVVKRSQCPYKRKAWERDGGVFLQDSTCFIPEKKLDHPIFADTLRLWRRNGINYDILKLDKGDNTNRRKIAARRQHDQIVKYHTRLVTGIINADEKLTKAQKVAEANEIPLTEKEQGRLIVDRHSKVRTIIRNATADLLSAVKNAEDYETTEAVKDLLDGLRASIRAQAHDFNEAARDDGVKQVAVP